MNIVIYSKSNCPNRDAGAQQQEPVQKPLAWVPKWAIARLQGKMGAVANPVTWGVDAPLYNGEARDCEPIYITPPQRKPLTEEEIQTYRHMIDWTAEWSYIKFVRAIEAAHGIKGEA